MPSENTLRAVASQGDLPPYEASPISTSAVAAHLGNVLTGYLDSALQREGFPWSSDGQKKEFTIRLQALIANAVSRPEKPQAPAIDDDRPAAAEDHEPEPTADTTMSDSTQDATDAKIAAAEARTDTKLAGLKGHFDVLTIQLEHIASSIKDQRLEVATSRTAVITTVVGVGAALAALLWAAITYGDSVFSHGMVVKDVVDAAVHEAIKQVSPKTP